MNLRIAPVFALLLFYSIMSGCNASPPSKQQTAPSNSSQEARDGRLDKAWKAYNRNDLRKSLEILNGYDGSRDVPVDVPLLLGNIHYRQNDFGEAAQHWKRASTLGADHNFSRQLQKRIQRAEKLSSYAWRRQTFSHFEILVPESLDYGIASRLNHDLESAYDNVGGDLSFFPAMIFSVILHEPNTFHRVIQAPSWSSGVFDGKIHLLIHRDRSNTYSVPTLYHEYTHAVVYHLAQNHVPIWLNEGLATYEETRQTGRDFQVRLLSTYPPARQLKNLQQIDRIFRNPRDETIARLAYEYSYTLVDFLRERHGFNQIRRLMQNAGKERSFSQALHRVLSRNEQDLFEQWKHWLKGRYIP